MTMTNEQARIIGQEIGKELGAALVEAIKSLPPTHRLRGLETLSAPDPPCWLYRALGLAIPQAIAETETPGQEGD